MKIEEIEATILSKGTGAVKGNCHFCGEEVDGMCYCFGCKKFVCPNCDETQVIGRHTVEEHKRLED